MENPRPAISEDHAGRPDRDRYRIADLRGIVPALPDRDTVDFDDLISEAFEELKERD